MDIEKLITSKLREAEAKEKALHSPSGKLSAGMLYKPLLEQVLKLIGVPPAPVSDYALRLFERGKQVENWVINLIGPDETQKEVEYKEAVGLVDVIKDGVLIEVKSVKGSQWRWLQKEGARWNHRLQAGLYALALEKASYQILYVCADDFRTMLCELNTADVAPEINKIVAEVDKQLKNHQMPLFEAREAWQGKPEYAEKYSDYGDWLSLSPDLAMEKLRNQYPDAYKKLTNWS